MDPEVYDRLVDSLALRGGALRSRRCAEFRALVEELFTEEEAALAGAAPAGSVPAAKIAEAAGKPVPEATAILERMADKGLAISSERQGVTRYAIPPLMPGIFELQFKRGTASERDKRLARLFESYFEALRKAPGAEGAPSVPFARVIAVERQIPARLEVHPYDRVSEYIDATDTIAVSACYCRHHGELLGNPCDKPKDVCLALGPSAKFMVERGFARPVSREEAREILDACEEAGLVHCSSNTGAYVDFLCNCCVCHCGILQALKEGRTPSLGASSGYVVEADEEACVGCKTCVDRCPMDALALDDDVITRDAARCIGCGLCVSACPTGALRLGTRSGHPAPPADRRELTLRMAESRKK